MRSKTVWIAEYNPQERTEHINTLEEMMEQGISNEWIILSFHSTIDDADELGEAAVKKIGKDLNRFAGDRSTIKAHNEKQLAKYLQDRASALSKLISENENADMLTLFELVENDFVRFPPPNDIKSIQTKLH